VEHVEDVLAVGGADDGLVLQARDVGVERLRGAGVQVVPAREDDALVVRQPPARLRDAVEPHDLLGADVEHQVPPRRLVVRADAEQDQRPDPGVQDVGVREGLQRLVHRLGVDARPAVGVVLDLDGERPADRLDEHLALDRDVRVPAEDVVVAGGLDPVDVVRGRERVVALALVVLVRDGAVGRGPPPQHPEIGQARAGLEHREQPPVHQPQLEQPRLPVVPVHVGEVALEPRVVQQARHRLRPGRDERDAVPVPREAVQGEHVVDRRLRLQPEEDVVAEQHHPAERHHVPRDAVVRRPDLLGARQPQLRPAEDLQPPRVQRLRAPRQLRRVLGEPRPQHLVRPVVQFRPPGLGGLAHTLTHPSLPSLLSRTPLVPPPAGGPGAAGRRP
jgi:hypothetical protein